MSSKLPFIFLNRMSQKEESFCFSSKKVSFLIDPYIRKVIPYPKDYEITFTISPLSRVYEVSGEIKTSFPLECVVCLRAYEEPLEKVFCEIWSPPSQNSHFSERHLLGDCRKKKDLSYFQPLKSFKVNLGKWLEELLLSLKPSYPKPLDCDDNCIYRREFMSYTNYRN